MRKKINILHIFNDEKFVDSAINLFDSNEDNKSFYLIIKDKNKDLKHTKSKNIIILNDDEVNDHKKINKIISENKIQVIGLHALNSQKKEILKKLENNLVIIWFLFGFDLYNSYPLYRKKLYEPKTKEFLNRHKTFVKRKLIDIITNKYIFSVLMFIPFEKIRVPLNLENKIKGFFPRDYLHVLKKINYVAPVIKDEMKFINELNKKLKFLPFSYSYIEYLLGDKFEQDLKLGNNILIGNSANPTNNHIDIFYKISDLKFDQSKIIIPLSYSGNQEYINYIKTLGKKFFKDKFIPLTDFMDYNTYLELLTSCSYAIFNHIRQQAVGNIIVMLYLGSKVFLNKKSPVYKFLLNNSVIVYNTEEINLKSLSHPLNKEQIRINKKKLIELFGKETVNKKIKEMMYILKNDLNQIKNNQ